MNRSPSTALWRLVQRKNFTSWHKLFEFLQLSHEHHQQIISDNKFPLNIPLRLAQKVAKQTIDDPILRQFLPTQQEKILDDQFLLEPLVEQEFRKTEKLLHKYEARVLLITTQACAMHCRYCFRKNFSYKQEDHTFQKEIEYIKQNNSIKEVILSGGDPLSLEQSLLEKLVEALDKLQHVKRLRFHTRFPIGIPERIDEKFIAMLERIRMQVWFVIHCNHPKELDADIFVALKKVQKLGIPVLNQSVLLKGVNDDEKILIDLYQKMIDQGIMPYYIHQLDRVQGATHFEVDIDNGKDLIAKIAGQLPGYGVPKYAQEIPGLQSKTQIVSIHRSNVHI